MDLIKARIKDARDYSDSLSKEMNETRINNETPKSNIAISLFTITHHHYDAIILLMEDGSNLSAGTLMRPLFESYVRGLWICKCAKEGEINEISEGKRQFKNLKKLANTVVSITSDDSKILNEIISKLNDFTHNGILTIKKMSRSQRLEAQFHDNELEEILNYSELILGGAIRALSHFINDKSVQEKVQEIIKNRRKLLSLSNTKTPV